MHNYAKVGFFLVALPAVGAVTRRTRNTGCTSRAKKHMSKKANKLRKHAAVQVIQ